MSLVSDLKKGGISSFFELGFMNTIVSYAILGLVSPVGYIEEGIRSSMMDQDMIVNSIYGAIKHEYFELDGHFSPVEPKIAWPAVLQWMGQIAEKRNINIFNQDNNELEPRFVETDEQDKKNLTKAGVRLLLWDLGILSYF
jgi:hypothetical protein